MRGHPQGSVVSSYDALRETIADAVTQRGFYIAGPEELSCISTGMGASEAHQCAVLETFAVSHGWVVTVQRGFRAALFQVRGREVLAPDIWMAAATTA